MGVDAQIESSLAARLELMAYPVKWMGDRSYDPASGTPYLEAAFFNSSTTRFAITANQPHIMLGFLQVAVMSPLSDGLGAAKVIAEAVKAHFPDGSRYGPATIQQAPAIETAYEDGSWMRVPVTVYWRAHG